MHLLEFIVLSQKTDGNEGCSSSTATWIDLEMIILTEVSRRQIYDITYLWNLKKYSTNELICKIEIESQM